MIDPRSFRQLMGCFATGITVVTALDKKLGPVGLTVNSFTSVSLKPPLVLFCLDKGAHLYGPLSRAQHFAVNILGEAQEDISRYFADYRNNPMPKNMWGKMQASCPLLRNSLGWMICKKTTIYKGGDHIIVLGEAIKLTKRAGKHTPLLYYHGRYRKIGK